MLFNIFRHMLFKKYVHAKLYIQYITKKFSLIHVITVRLLAS